MRRAPSPVSHLFSIDVPSEVGAAANPGPLGLASKLPPAPHRSVPDAGLARLVLSIPTACCATPALEASRRLARGTNACSWRRSRRFHLRGVLGYAARSRNPTRVLVRGAGKGSCRIRISGAGQACGALPGRAAGWLWGGGGDFAALRYRAKSGSREGVNALGHRRAKGAVIHPVLATLSREASPNGLASRLTDYRLI